MQLILFAVTQGTIFQFWTPDILRGYGCGTPNGTLWTVGVMIQTYIVLYLLFKILHKEKTVRWVAALSVSIVCSCSVLAARQFLPELIYKLLHQTFIPYLWIFLVGAFITEKFDAVMPWIKKYFWIFLLLSLLCMITDADIQTSAYPLIRCGALVIGFLGFAYAFPMLKIRIDISYALFLYHMTVVNVMIQKGVVGKIEYAVTAMIISMLIAFISSLTVGRRTQVEKTTRNQRENKLL